MTLLQNTGQGGTNGAAVTTANSGGASGDAFTAVAISGNQTVTYDTAHVRAGQALAWKIAASGTSGTAYLAWSGVLNGSQWSSRLYVYLTALPTAEVGLIWLSSGTTAQASVGFLATGKLVQRASGTAGTGNSGSTIVPLNQWVRIEFSGTIGAGNGTMQSSLFTASNGESTTAAETLSTTGQNTGSANFVNARFGYVSTNTLNGTIWVAGAAIRDDTTTPLGPLAPAANLAPTVTAGATVVMTSGSTANVVFTANDADGTIASWETPSVTSTADTAPTVGAPTLSGIGTANATATYPVSGLTNSDTTVTTRPVDNSGAPAASYASARIVYTSTAPKAKAVTLVGCTMTSPASGTPKAAWNNWLANPYDASTNAGGVQPPEFTTAAPPASNATVTVDYQPLDVANVPPSFSQSWALTPDTATPTTVYVDMRFSGVTKATATTVLSSTTAVPVGRTLSADENAAVGSGTLARVAPTVVGRFA